MGKLIIALGMLVFSLELFVGTFLRWQFGFRWLEWTGAIWAVLLAVGVIVFGVVLMVLEDDHLKQWLNDKIAKMP